MLKRLYVDNYKCLVGFELRLDELSLLLGANGAGKSSVFDVVFGLRELLSGRARLTDPEVLPTRTLTRWQSRNLQTVEVEAEVGGEVLVYRLEIEHLRETRQAAVALERLSAASGVLFEFQGGEVRLYRDDHTLSSEFRVERSESALARISEHRDNQRHTRFLDFMRRILVCSLYPRSFAAESTSEDALLARDGRNFAAWYRHVFQERQDLVPGYVEAVREVLPGFTGIRLEKVGQEARVLLAVFDSGDHRFELRLDELSDGQRALLALYALIHVTAGQGYSLFLDEPDNYVALPEIQPWLLSLVDACGDTLPQAVLCSHHPELIDYLGSDRGVLFFREASGGIRAQKPEPPQPEGGLKLSEVIARGWER